MIDTCNVSTRNLENVGEKMQDERAQFHFIILYDISYKLTVNPVIIHVLYALKTLFCICLRAGPATPEMAQRLVQVLRRARSSSTTYTALRTASFANSGYTSSSSIRLIFSWFALVRCPLFPST